MKVNMTPNPLDVVTIHASQGDTEAREWEFELHNNGELIDTSEITEQLFFKSYKGGTEQILPENTSTPTTSPFKGDIKYPQGLLSDQEFTYRQSPTEEDGLAKITDIKGNTLVWNQLVQNGNFADTSLWRTYASTGFSVSNNIGSFTVTGATGAIYQTSTPTYVNGHKYLVIADFYVSQQTNISVEVSGTRGKTETVNANTWYKYSDIVTPSAQGNFSLTCGQASVQVKNVMCFDLTKMGLDITDPSDFTSLFPLSYYSYNQGSLLSFNGNGLKTTGKNEANIPFEQGAVSQTVGFTYQASKVSSATRIRCASLAVAEKNNIYKCDWNTSIYDCVVQAYGENRLSTGTSVSPFNTWFTVPFMFTGTGYVAIAFKRKDGANITPSEIDAIRPNLYLADTESTLSLPISTYFPTGMKSAGNVYDELTESKAITRVGAVVFNGTQNITGPTVANNFWIEKSDVVRSNDYRLTMTCDKLDVVTSGNDSAVRGVPKWISAYPVTSTSPDTNWIYIHVDGITTKEDLTTWLQANPVTLNYELKTPTETSFKTASLVTENAEIPLSNEDGTLIGKCTEQLSENPGFIDAKIKLSDSDGECYSNKLQLHVERSPQ